MAGRETGEYEIFTVAEGDDIGIAGRGLDEGFVLSLTDNLQVLHIHDDKLGAVKLFLPSVEGAGGFAVIRGSGEINEIGVDDDLGVVADGGKELIRCGDMDGFVLRQIRADASGHVFG